ncbi:MAG: hypothetical protein M3T56_08995 [Chloroflexota bacterium]|nr:hypothetical protein [Chloroflexota bacterium]
MRPFRSRVLAAIVFAILVLGLLGTVADAAGIPTRAGFPEDPWGFAGTRHSIFPEDPWLPN